MVDPTIRIQANKQERDREVIALVYLSTYPAMADELVADINKSLGQEVSLRDAIDPFLKRLAESLANASATAYTQARMRSLSFLKDTLDTNPLIGKLFPGGWYLWARQFDKQEEEKRKQYFLFWLLAAQAFVDVLASSIVSHLRYEGKTLEEKQKETEELLKKAGVFGNFFVVDSIYNTTTHDAYQKGIRDINEEQPISKVLRGYQYVTMRDDRVRPTHREAGEMNGGYAEKSNIERLTYFDKLLHDWGCRCTLVAIYGLPDEPVILL